MLSRISTVAAAWLVLAPIPVVADGLAIGDLAPPLTLSMWVKGEAVERIEPGRIYVVDFWATWCGACRATYPHLTELQRKYPAVTFIGVSIWERDGNRVGPFVQEMGDSMAYRIAQDDVPAGSQRGIEGKMATAWMKAAGEDGIPTVFIVGKDGRIAWIGRPSDMDTPLAKVIAGTWDMRVAAQGRERNLELARAFKRIGEQLRPLQRDKAKNHKAIVALLDKEMAANPAIVRNYAAIRYEAMLYGEDWQVASAVGATLVDSTNKNDPAVLNYIAWVNVSPESGVDEGRRNITLALRAARLASELQGSDYGILNNLALALFHSGDAVRAAEIEQKAVELSERKIPVLIERLEKFRKAAETK